MKNGGKNKSVAFIILVSVYSIHQVNIKYVNNRHAHKQLANSENWS